MKEIGKDIVEEYVSDLKALVSGHVGDVNDEQTRQEITTALMQYIRHNYSDAKEYRVVCDSTNNTSETIDKGMLMIDLVPREKGITIKTAFSPDGNFLEGSWDVTVE